LLTPTPLAKPPASTRSPRPVDRKNCPGRELPLCTMCSGDSS
jgi:hypothetical protein